MASASALSNTSTEHSASQPAPQDLEADIALLTHLLSQGVVDESDPVNVTELLQRLEQAEGLADGLESRLDGIIDNLDTLLSDLEAEGGTSAVEVSEVVLEEIQVSMVSVEAESSKGEGEGDVGAQK